MVESPAAITVDGLGSHPDIGAEMVARTGANPDTIRMIREQDAESPDQRLALLQAADEA